MAGSAAAPLIVITGANGLVGARICETLAGRGVRLAAVVRRPGTAPEPVRDQEVVGDFTDPAFASRILDGATAVISTVHPMGADRGAQHRVGVEGTAALARAAVTAGAERFIHISTAAVYDRSPGVGDVDENAGLVGDDAGDYAVTKRDADHVLGEVDGLTRVLLRPPAILGPGPTSVWNTLRPAQMREDEAARHAIPEQTWPWVHVSDLAQLAADVADTTIPAGDDPARGPVHGGWVAVNVAAPRATQRDYVGTVTRALGLEPAWEDGEAWTGALAADRARAWGWRPRVSLEQTLAELAAGLGERLA